MPRKRLFAGALTVLAVLGLLLAGYAFAALHTFHSGGLAGNTGDNSGVVVSPGTNGFTFDNANSGTSKIEVRYAGSINTYQKVGSTQFLSGFPGYASNVYWRCYNNTANPVNVTCTWSN